MQRLSQSKALVLAPLSSLIRTRPEKQLADLFPRPHSSLPPSPSHQVAALMCRLYILKLKCTFGNRQCHFACVYLKLYVHGSHFSVRFQEALCFQLCAVSKRCALLAVGIHALPLPLPGAYSESLPVPCFHKPCSEKHILFHASLYKVSLSPFFFRSAITESYIIGTVTLPDCSPQWQHPCIKELLLPHQQLALQNWAMFPYLMGVK